MIDDIALFVHIVQHRGLAAAAEHLTLPAATVTRRLQKLEARVGHQLIHRSARQFNLTQEGEVYFQAYADLVQQFEITSKHLNSEQHQLSGPLKVLAPTNISLGILQPAWSAFIKAYPDIHLQLQLNNSTEDVIAAQADIAIRIGPQSDSLLYQKRLGVINTVVVASPNYLSSVDELVGAPCTLDDLHEHKIIGVNNLSTWQLTNNETRQQVMLHPKYTTTVNDIRFASQLACDGLGIALLPISEIKKELDAGILQQVLCNWSGPARDVFAVWPSGKLLNAKAKCLLEFMQLHSSQEPILQGENAF
jgi:LysR family transcriptional regulator AphB